MVSGMGPDSLGFAALLLLAVAAYGFARAGGRKAHIRLNLRFAAALWVAPALAALAAAVVPAVLGAAFAAALLVAPLAAAALALSCAGPRPAPPWIASLVLSAGLSAGLYAALMGGAVPALLVLVLSAAGIGFSTPLRGPGFAQTVAGATALLAGGLALSQGAMSGAFVFFAAGLLSRVLQPRVEERGVLLLTSAIGRARL